MELAATLKSQGFQEAIREVGINPNHWYPMAWSHEIKSGTVGQVMVWNRAIALYRDHQGHLHALDNACAHKGVELHRGEVRGENLVCPYHGWEFGPGGQCIHIPYWPEGHKLPCASLRAYPVRELHGLIWVFPGDPALAPTLNPPAIPELSDPEWLMVPITARFQAHFSICNENTMDVFHGFLHRHLNGWFNPVLLSLREGSDEVLAEYRVSYRGWISKFLRLAQDGNPTTTRKVSLHYRYPHYHSRLEGVSSLHLLRLPVGPTETRSFSLLFVKLQLPKALQQWLKPLIVPGIRRYLFMPFLRQDIEMVESEQRTYAQNPQRHYVEINPAIIALQRVIIRQFEQSMQQSSQFFQPRGARSTAEQGFAAGAEAKAIELSF